MASTSSSTQKTTTESKVQTSESTAKKDVRATESNAKRDVEDKTHTGHHDSNTNETSKPSNPARDSNTTVSLL